MWAVEGIGCLAFFLIWAVLIGYVISKSLRSRTKPDTKVHKPIAARKLPSPERPPPRPEQTVARSEVGLSSKTGQAPAESEPEPPPPEPRPILNDGVDIEELLRGMGQPVEDGVDIEKLLKDMGKPSV